MLQRLYISRNFDNYLMPLNCAEKPSNGFLNQNFFLPQSEKFLILKKWSLLILASDDNSQTIEQISF